MRWRRGAGCAAALLLGATAGCGADQERETAGRGQERAEQVSADAVGLEPLAGLTAVVTDRRPDVTAGPGGIVAYAGTDFGVGNTDTDLALSTDDGRSFQRIEFEPRLADLGVVVGEEEILVVGSPCTEPDGSQPDAVCAPTEPRLAAYTVDLATDESAELPVPPIVGFVKDSVGAVGDRLAVIVSADAGPTLLSWGEAGWESEALPAATTQVCTGGGVLTAITNGQSLAEISGGATPTEPAEVDGPLATVAPPPIIEPVAPGDPLWSAQMSPDDGRTWGDPIPFPAGETPDYGFSLGVLCGPRAVLVHTAQIAVLDPGVGSWTTIATDEEAPVAPGAGGTWVDDDTVRMWATPTVGSPVEAGEGGAAPPDTTTTIEISGLLDGDPDAKAMDSGLPPGVTPSPLRGAGATQAGLVLLVGSTFDLARAV